MQRTAESKSKEEGRAGVQLVRAAGGAMMAVQMGGGGD
jgi:hypothetical protein